MSDEAVKRLTAELDHADRLLGREIRRRREAEFALAQARARVAEVEEENAGLRAALEPLAHPLPSDMPAGAWYFKVDSHAVMRARRILGATEEGG